MAKLAADADWRHFGEQAMRGDSEEELVELRDKNSSRAEEGEDDEEGLAGLKILTSQMAQRQMKTEAAKADEREARRRPRRKRKKKKKKKKGGGGGPRRRKRSRRSRPRRRGEDAEELTPSEGRDRAEGHRSRRRRRRRGERSQSRGRDEAQGHRGRERRAQEKEEEKEKADEGKEKEKEKAEKEREEEKEKVKQASLLADLLEQQLEAAAATAEALAKARAVKEVPAAVAARGVPQKGNCEGKESSAPLAAQEEHKSATGTGVVLTERAYASAPWRQGGAAEQSSKGRRKDWECPICGFRNFWRRDQCGSPLAPCAAWR